MPEPFVGVQTGSDTLLHEGIEQALDLMQETAGINALVIHSHSTFGADGRVRPLRTLASDHGVPPMEYPKRNLPGVWVKTHEEYYGGTSLRWPKTRPDREWADRDLFNEVMGPARKRGMKVYARSLGFRPYMPNGPKTLNIDVYGRPLNMPCYNNPDYINFTLSTMEDLFKSYPELDGFMWGPERTGPIGHMLYRWSAHSETTPFCFCTHCQAKGQARGINVERARTGMTKLFELVRSLQAGQPAADGAFVTFLRTLLKYPEILAWEQLWYDSKEDLARMMYGVIKAIRPSAEYGLHVHHPVATWDLFNRAMVDYADMTTYADWIKPVVYHDIAGPRLRKMGIGSSHASIFRDVPEDLLLEFTYRVFGYDPAQEPKLDVLFNSSLSPEYVYRETKRCVDDVAGKALVYSGVGFDVPILLPDGAGHRHEDPERVYQATRRALDAGADGLLISREYNEMEVDNLQAVGRAVRERA